MKTRISPDRPYKREKACLWIGYVKEKGGSVPYGSVKAATKEAAELAVKENYPDWESGIIYVKHVSELGD
jgi:hypothetical protein